MKDISCNKVLIYAHHVPPQPSASSTRLLSLARYLKNQGILVEFLTTKSGPVSHEGFVIHRCSGRAELFRKIFTHARCPILISSPPGTPAAEVAALSRLLGYRVIVDIRDPFVSEALLNGDLSPGWRTWLKLGLERSMFYTAHKISYVSDALRILIEGRFELSNKSYVIAPNGIDCTIFNYTEESRNLARKKLGFENEVVFVYAGILGGKSLDKMLDAIAPVLLSGAKLLMIAVLDEFSTPIYKKLIKQAIDNCVDKNITWLFNLSSDEVAVYLNGSDIGINPLPFDRNYCLPVKTFEFLACGVYPLNIVGKQSALLEVFSDKELGAFCFSWDEFMQEANKMVLNISRIRSSAAFRANSATQFDRKHANIKIAGSLLSNLNEQPSTS